MDGVQIEIGLLGALEVTVDGRPVDLPRGRVRALLAVLALTPGQRVAAGTLAERVWGTQLPADARATLHTYVMRLRRVLGSAAIATSAGGYLLDARPEAVDAVRFTRLLDQAGQCDDPRAERGMLADALALWRGTPFDPPLSDWLAQNERPALVERRLRAVERLAELNLAVGRCAELVPDLRDLIRKHPLRESLWVRLLASLDGAGRPAEALAAYETVRSLLARELGAEPGVELQRLYADLLAGKAQADHPVVPQQVPSGVDDFTGRHEALRTLDRDSSLIAVHGPGGVGKTALVLHWANKVRPQFPDGQLYVDLDGYGSGQPLDPATALDTMLRGLGVPGERIPDGVDARSSLLRTTLAGRRVLVVLDNARDADQVRPLLPGAGSVAVVTSRSQLRGLAARERAHRIALDGLPSSEAVAFLAGRLDRHMVAYDNDSLRVLAGLCGGLPLALAAAAERAGRHPDRPLAELIRRLREERERLVVLEIGAVTASSYRLLDPEAARMYRLLGLHPGAEISAHAAAALTGADRSSAARMLDRLAETHLVASPRPGRYAMADVIRADAAGRAADDPRAEHDAAIRRLHRWYARSATSASETVWGSQAAGDVGPDALGFTDDHQAMSWFGTERQTLLALIAESVRLGLHPEVVQLVRAVSTYLDLSRVPVEIKAWQELALASARAAGDDLAEAQLLVQLGRTHEQLGELIPALRCFQAGYQLHRELDDPVGECAALGNIGIIRWRLGKPGDAIRYVQRSIATARRRGLHDRTAAGLNILADVRTDIGSRLGRLRGQGQHAEAEAAARESVRLFRDTGLQLRESIAVDALGAVQLAGGDHVGAASRFAQAVEIRREIGGGWRLAYSLRNLGRAQRTAGDVGGARTSWSEALQVLEHAGAADSARLSRSELRGRLAELAG